MMLTVRTLLFFIVFLLSFQAYANEVTRFKIYSSAESLSYSEASAVYQIYNNHWDDYPRANGKQAFSRNRFIIGAQYQYYAVEYLKRTDITSRFSPDTAAALYYYNHEKSVPNGQVFAVDLRARIEKSHGVRFGILLPEFWNIKITPRFSFLQTLYLQQGDINGQFYQPNKDEYVGTGRINYYSHSDKIFGLPNHLYSDESLAGPSGQAVSLDLTLSWHYQNFYTDIELQDLWYQSQWRNANHREGVINLNTQLEGLHTESSLSGKASRLDYQLSPLPIFSRIHSYYQWQNWQTGLGAWNYFDNTFGFFSTAYNIGKHQFGARIETRNYKVSALYQWQGQRSHAGFILGSDRLNLKQAHALEISMQAAFAF